MSASNKSPLISVIVPTFNRARVVSRAIRSITTQTYPTLEIIVIDDGSSDGTIEAVEQLQREDTRIRLLIHDVNKGGSAARNTGIDAASGELIAFLDSDDEWAAEKLETQVKQWLSLEDKEYSIMYCKYRICNGNRKISVRPKRDKRRTESLSDYLFCNNGFIQTSGLLIPSAVARECPFLIGLRRHQDYAFLFDAETYGTRFEFVDEVLVTVHWEDRGLVSDNWSVDVSRAFYERWRNSFTEKAASRFLFLQTVVAPLGHSAGLVDSMRAMKSVRLRLLSWRNWASLAKRVVLLVWKARAA